MSFIPEFFNRLELLISSIGVILGLFFGVFLFIKRHKYSKANLFLALYLLAFSLRILKSLFHNYYTINNTILTLFLGLFLVVGPSLWFYVNHFYRNDYYLKRKIYYLHYFPFFGILIFCGLIPNSDNTYPRIFYLILFFHGLIYCFYTFYWLFKIPNPYYNDIQKSVKIKRWLMALTAVTTLMFINSVFIFFDIVSFYPSSSFLFSLIIVFLVIWGLNNLWLFKAEKAKYSKSILSNERASEYSNKLLKLMENEKLFLDPDLTLVKLSELMSISSKQLSQLINQTENMNYSHFIAKYRVEEAKNRLIDPNYSSYKITAIAYDSGFNSISSFNSSFKKLTNTTAINYRESFLKNQ